MLKVILRIVVLLVLLAVVLGVVVVIYVDRLAAKTLTEGVEHAGGVACTAEGVDLSLLSGRLRIRRLAVMNPPGYSQGSMFVAEGAEVKVKTRSLWNQPVHVRRLEIEKLLISIEGGGQGTNVKVFLENAKRRLAANDAKRTRMWVDKVVIRQATVRFGGGVVEEGLMDIDLESIELLDIRGPNGRGVTTGGLTAMIVLELVRKAALAGDLNVKTFVPPELMAGLGTFLQMPGMAIKGAADIIKGPLGVILKPLTSRPAREGGASP
jgi:hypothetical protein